ncbi:Transcription factor DIVARICATA [Quillaja saponaria]|uniref:Transcription factor DIVARICATA n=1 Tax=Quillaja saponaria TaxID=32244 RepID=A0AAD7LKQ8_QUISA|nr:Transcription factor DIVARICATA [Quillaja saponaria]
MEVLSPPSYIPNTNWLVEERRSTKWTPPENKIFENALAVYDKDTPDRWHKVAAMIPGKTVVDVTKQYKELVADVCNIEAGLVPFPGYDTTSAFIFDWVNTHEHDGFKQTNGLGVKRSSSARPGEQERKKGVPWTEEEHKLFLLGLEKYGKGDWRNISRNFVITRTPTQVASHAQKYFIRQISGGKDKRRASIHDITTVNLTDTTKTSPPSEDSKKLPSPQNSMMLLQQHQQRLNFTTTPRSHLEWNQPNAGVDMARNPTREKMFLLSPYGVDSSGIKLQNLQRDAIHESYLGPQTQNMVFQMQSAQHYSRV